MIAELSLLRKPLQIVLACAQHPRSRRPFRSRDGMIRENYFPATGQYQIQIPGADQRF